MLVTITDSAFLNTCSVSSDVDLFVKDWPHCVVYQWGFLSAIVLR